MPVVRGSAALARLDMSDGSDRISQTSPGVDVGSGNPPAQESAGSFFDKLSATARLTRQQAYRRKLESVDLREADYAIGEKAYNLDTIPPEFGSLVTDLDAIQARLEAREQTQPGKQDSSFAEKAQTTARAAANKAKAEALKLKRSALLKDLGYKLRQHQAPDAILAPEIARAKAVQERIKLLDEEIERLRHHSWIRHPLVVVLGLALAALVLVGVLSLRHGRTAREVAGRQQQGQRSTTAREAAAMEEVRRQAEERMRSIQQQASKGYQAQMDAVQRMQDKYDQDQRDYVEKQKQEQAARAKAEQEKVDIQNKLQQQMAQKQEEERKRVEAEKRGKVVQTQQKEQELTKKRQQLAGSIVRTKAKIEEHEIAPTGTAVKYAVSRHALHIAATTMKGSRPVMLIDGVPGPQFDDLVAVGGEKFWQPSQMLHPEAERPDDDSNDRSSAPVVFSDDGSRWAYVGRAGNQFVVMLDGKVLSRIPFSEEAIASLSFTPGGKHLRYIQTEQVHDQSGESRRDTRLVVDGRKATVGAVNLRAGEVSWSPDGEHFVFITKSGDRLSDQLVLDNKVDPPELQFPGYALEHTRPLFTGDSAHLITVRRKLVQQSGSTRLGSQAVFFDRTPVVQAPSAIIPGSHQKTDAVLEEVSVAPMGSNFITVFRASANPFNLYFNDKRIASDAPARDNVHIGWSPNGKRYAILCGGYGNRSSSEFMIIDGKRQRDYRDISLRGANATWKPVSPFTADSSTCVYVGTTDKSFVVIDDAESDGYKRVDDVTFSQQGAHFAFIASDDSGQKVLVVDGEALEPRKDIHDFVFTPDGAHYAFLSGGERGAKVVVDGVEQPFEFGGDFVRYNTSSHQPNRQFVFSPDGKHVAYMSYADPKRTAKGICLDGKVFLLKSDKSEVTAFFTPDNQHFIWIDWGYKVTSIGDGSISNYLDVPGYGIYVDGVLAGAFDCPTVKIDNYKGITTSIARIFQQTANATEMGADGVLTVFAQAGEVIKKLRVTPAADTNLARFAAIADEQQMAGEDESKPAAEPEQ
jgi:hypothetical protein